MGLGSCVIPSCIVGDNVIVEAAESSEDLPVVMPFEWLMNASVVLLCCLGPVPLAT